MMTTNTPIPKASEDLYGYKSWRNSLCALPNGTVMCWTTGYSESTIQNNIKAGCHTKIMRVRKSNGVSDMMPAAWVYELKLCDAKGKEFKRTFHWRVEAIARLCHSGDVVLV